MELIIFDCDGVLVDSEPLSCRVLAEQFTEFGYPISTDEAIEKFKGGHLQDIIEDIENQVGQKAPEDFIQVFRQRSFELFREELKPISGIVEALDNIRFKKCVASNGPTHKTELNLGITGILHHFEDALFSAYDIKKWKPAPDLFLYAAKQMNAAPGNTIVVEDSIHGVEAARKAGMRVLAYCAEKDAEEMDALGAVTFFNMMDLPQLIEKIFS